MSIQVASASIVLPVMAHDTGVLLLSENILDPKLIKKLIAALKSLKLVSSARYNKRLVAIVVKYDRAIPTRELFRNEHSLDMIVQQTIREHFAPSAEQR